MSKPAIGVRVSGAGRALTLAGSTIDATEGGIPAVVRRGGTLELDGVTVAGGEGMEPMTVSDAGSRLSVRGGVLGGEAPGVGLVRAAQGGQASIIDATLQSILGPALIADGGSISVAGGSIDMDMGQDSRRRLHRFPGRRWPRIRRSIALPRCTPARTAR